MTLEELQEQLLTLQENLKVLTEDNKQLKEQINTKETRVKELEEYNQKLFLRATATHKQETPKEEFKSKLLGDYANLLSDDELEILKELEGDL